MFEEKPENNEVEVPLTGGNSNAQVVRKGQTVRRAVSPATSTVHKLLEHIRARGFHCCPKPLGLDQMGREVLSYIEGDTGINPDIWRSDKAMLSSVAMLRAYHDASAGFVHELSHRWAITPELSNLNGQSASEVICHNDFAPYNFVFNNANPVAVFDFDLCGPGMRINDFAYLAYWMVPLSFSAQDMKPFTNEDIANNGARLKALCASYPMAFDKELLDNIEFALQKMASEFFALQVLGEQVTQNLIDGGHLRHWHKEWKAFNENRGLLEALFE